MKECWKDVNGFEGVYQISNKGNLKSSDRYVDGKSGSRRFQKGKYQKPEITRKGYHRYTLSISRNQSVRKLAHVLVAEHFISENNHKAQVNHKDGNKDNNSIENLEWCSNLENMRHAIENGLVKPVYGTIRKKKGESPVSKKIAAYDTSKAFVGVYDSIIEASEQTGISRNAISRSINGRVKNARKLNFKLYSNE